MQQRQSDGQISQQLQSFSSGKQDTLSACYIQICAITHSYGLVYTVARGKDVGKKRPCLVSVSISTFDASVTYISLSSSVPPISCSHSVCLPALSCRAFSESQCILNSYVLVSYGYDLHWQAGVPFPFSALRAQYHRNRKVQCVYKNLHARQRRQCADLGLNTCITFSIMYHNCDLSLEWKHTSRDESGCCCFACNHLFKKVPCEHECAYCRELNSTAHSEK